jgi:hypothetical protein
MNSGSLRELKLMPESLEGSMLSSTNTDALAESVPHSGQERGWRAMTALPAQALVATTA